MMTQSFIQNFDFYDFQIELEAVRPFRRTTHNTYEYINLNEMDKADESYANAGGNNRKIRPTTYKTFLKVKNIDNVSEIYCTSPSVILRFRTNLSLFLHQFQNNKASKQGLFAIEWIPNTLPISKHGEMRIKFKFGHMKNDKIYYKNEH